MDSSKFYEKPMHRVDNRSDDESDNLEESVFETESSEIDSDSLESISDQSYGEMSTTEHDDGKSDAEDQTNQLRLLVCSSKMTAAVLQPGA